MFTCQHKWLLKVKLPEQLLGQVWHHIPDHCG